MAIHAHSTPMPAPQRGLLRALGRSLSLPKSGDTPAPTGLVPAHDTRLVAQPWPVHEGALSSEPTPLLLKSQENPEACDALLPAPLPSLTSAFSRRRAIFGAVALAAAPLAVQPAQAAPEPAMSVEAAELHTEFQSVLEAYQAASARHEAAEAAFVYVEAPEALYARPGDAVLLGFRSPVRSFTEGRRWYAERTLIDDLREAPFRYMSGHTDELAVARRDQIVGAWDRWLDDTKVAEDACGYTAAYEAWVIAQDAYHDFRRRLIDLRTTDRDVMALKAQIVLERAINLSGVDDMLAAAMNADGIQQEAMAMSLVRDFIGQLGAAHREATHV